MGQVVGNQDGVGYRTVEAVASVNADGQIIGGASAPVQVAATTPLPTTNAVIDSTGQPFNLDACTHVYARNILGRPLTDTATDGTSTWVKTYSYDAQLSDVRREYLQRDFTALEAQYADTIRLQKKAKDAQAKAAVRVRAAADAAVLRDSLDRLRDAADTALRESSDSIAACTDHGATITELFGQCASRYGEVAGEADKWVNEALTLREAWPK